MTDRNSEIRENNFDKHMSEFSEKLKDACAVQKDYIGFVGTTKTKDQYSHKAQRYQALFYATTIISLILGAFTILGTGLANIDKLNWFGKILTYGSLTFVMTTLYLWLEANKQNRIEIVIDPKFKPYAFGDKFWYQKIGSEVVASNYREMDIISKTLARDKSSLTFKSKFCGKVTIAFRSEKDTIDADAYLCKKIIETKS